MAELPEGVTIQLGAPETTGLIRGDTMTVTINRPEKRNALTADGYHGIKRAAMIVADEPSLQFLVIRGTDDVFWFVTSANLTEAALDRNVELGLLVRDRALALSVVSHFRGLIDRGLLSPLPAA